MCRQRPGQVERNEDGRDDEQCLGDAQLGLVATGHQLYIYSLTHLLFGKETV